MNELIEYKELDGLPVLFTEKELRNVIFKGKLSKNNTYGLLHSEGFPTIHIGRKMFISREGFRKWLEHKEKV